MTPEQRRAFARHLSLAEIGEPGQERLLGTRVRAASGTDARVARWAEEYVTRAGARWDVRTAEPVVSASSAEVRATAGREALEEAAAFLLGALGALEHVRRTVLPPGARPLVPFALATEREPAPAGAAHEPAR